MRMRRIKITCGVRLYHIFPQYLINGTIFGKKLLENKVRVLISSTTFV